MRLSKLILLYIFIFTGSSLFAQETATPGNIQEEQEDFRIARLEYDIRLKFPLNATLGYRMDEETEYLRMYEDSSTYSFKRVYTYFFHMIAKEYPKDGMQKVEVFIDSLTYNFDDGKNKIHYFNSQNEGAPLSKIDFLKTYVPNSKEFSIYYDYYGDVVKIDGDMLEEKRFEITDPVQGIINNSRLREFYLNRMSKDDLAHIADLGKRLLPETAAKKDSIWKTDLDFDINYETFATLADTKFTKLISNHYYIEAVADSMTMKNKKYMVEDLKKEATVDKSFASGKLSLRISTNGIMKDLSAQFHSKVKAHIGNTSFTETIKTQTNWTQTGMWR